MTAGPLVSVGLPVFDGERYLGEALRSLLSQDLELIEVLIGDNGSTDRTREVVDDIAGGDPRVRRFYSDRNRGATWNYNRLVDEARAPYFKWAAHDDVCAPAFLRRCVDCLEGDSAAVLAYPRTILIGADGEVLDGAFADGLAIGDDEPLARFRRYMVHTGEQHAIFGVIRTAALRRTGRIANCWGGDQVTLAELLLLGRFLEVPERLFLRRYHPASSMVANDSPAAVARWFDPSKRASVAMPRTRLTAEMLAVAARAPLPPPDRARLAAAVLTRWGPRYARVIAGEAKLKLRSVLGERPPAPASR